MGNPASIYTPKCCCKQHYLHSDIVCTTAGQYWDQYPIYFFGKKGRAARGKKERFILPCDYWHRAWDLHHTHVKVSEFIFTGQFSSSHSAQSRMTPPLYLLATPTPQDLNQPDFSFSFIFLTFCFPWSWKFERKDKRRELTEILNTETCNLANQHEELSGMKKFWQGDLHRLQYIASDILCICVSAWEVSPLHLNTNVPFLAMPPAFPHFPQLDFPDSTFSLALQHQDKMWQPQSLPISPHGPFFFPPVWTFSPGEKHTLQRFIVENLNRFHCGNLPLLCLACSYPQPDQNTTI